MAASANASDGGGIFLLIWGIIATVIGGLLVTNFRGFARWFQRNAEASNSGLRRIPPWRRLPDNRGSAGRLRLVRTLGGVFAVMGPVALVSGVVLTVRGQGGALLHQTPRPSGFASFISLLIAAGWLVQFWRPGGYLAAAWRRGGAARRILTVIATAGALGFAAAWSVNLPLLAPIAILIGGFAMLAVASPLSRRVGVPYEAEGESETRR